MADSSSTSSSKPVHIGVPWGLIGALVIVIGVEFVLRGVGRMKLIAFASDEGQYHAVRDTIDAQGPAEVALIGSSQMRESVFMPLLLENLKMLKGRPVWAANYAMRGARVDVVDAAVRYLKRQPNPPQLIVVGLSARDLRATQPDWPRTAIFWSIRDWWREVSVRGHHEAAAAVLPIVVRSETGRVLWSLRYREEISLWMQRKFARFGVDGSEDNNPILGQATAQHLGKRGTVVYSGGRVPLHKLFNHARVSYLTGQSAKTPRDMQQRLQALAAQFKSSPGGLWVEMPVAKPLMQWLIKVGQKSAFDASIAEALRGSPIPFLNYDDQQAAGALRREKFRDLQHLNRTGAQQFSRWLATQIAPLLSPAEPGHSTAEKNRK